jgi:predicted PurR-regulated permease PerM
MEQRTVRNNAKLAKIAAIALLSIGCLYVLQHFLAAILFAACVVISTWPLYLKLLTQCRGRHTVAAMTMSLSLTLVVILPLALVAWTLADDVGNFYEQARIAIETGTITPPSWLKDIPLVGESISNYLDGLVHSRDQMIELARRMLEPARKFLLSGGIVLGAGVAQVSLAAFVSFFLYRDGLAIVTALGIAMQRIMGEGAAKVAGIVGQTVRGVMYGLLGTALAQALVAALGFAIAGVPGVPLLGVATFILSLVPVGPPIVWGGAAIWLFNQGQNGWGVFMLVWGLVLISGVDNVVKPMLISRGSSLPFLLVLLGVLGGVLAFGFVGLFIGPTLLAVGYSLLRDWTGVGAETPVV